MTTLTPPDGCAHDVVDEDGHCPACAAATRITLTRAELAAALATPLARYRATSNPAATADQSRAIADEVFRTAAARPAREAQP